MAAYELESMQIILHSGNARSSAYEAMHLMKKGDVAKAKLLMAEAKDEILIAQKEHAKLLKLCASGEAVKIDLLLIHAEDHVASSQIAVDLIGEMIEMYERFGGENE